MQNGENLTAKEFITGSMNKKKQNSFVIALGTALVFFGLSLLSGKLLIGAIGAELSAAIGIIPALIGTAFLVRMLG